MIRRHRGNPITRRLHTYWCKDHRHAGKCVTALIERVRTNQKAA